MVKINDLFTWKNLVKPGKEIGIEVEVEANEQLPDFVLGWDGKADGSLRGFAKEYVTHGPVSVLEYKRYLETLYRELEIKGFNESRRCGVHIHLNVRSLTVEKTFNIITIYLMLENLLMKWVGKNREGNLFCLRASDAEYLTYSLIKDKKQGLFFHTTNHENFKYASINISTIKKFGSLEFRGLETPKDKDKIINWIKILLDIKKYAISVNNIQEVLYMYSNGGTLKLLKDIFNRDTVAEFIKIKDYSDAVKESVREVQPLIFTKLGTTTTKKVPHKNVNIEILEAY